MRAYARLIAGFVILFGWTACGDSLELGGRGSGDPSGSGGAGSLQPCLTDVRDPAGAPALQCSACGTPGEVCGAADQVTCCCSLGAETAAAAHLECFSNSSCCPAEPPTVGAPCGDCIDSGCTYCGQRAAERYICGPNGTWVVSQSASTC